MYLYSQNLMYGFHTKDLDQVESLKQYADHAVKEIKSTYGWDTDVQVNIEPESKDKRLFSVSMSVYGFHEPIVVKKTGKQILSVLRKVRKAVMRQIHRLTKKQVHFRKRMDKESVKVGKFNRVPCKSTETAHPDNRNWARVS